MTDRQAPAIRTVERSQRISLRGAEDLWLNPVVETAHLSKSFDDVWMRGGLTARKWNAAG